MWTRCDRLRRRLGFDRNQLRRRIDRVQWMLAVGLVVLFVAAATPVALWAGTTSYDSGMRAERREWSERHAVTATVVGPGGLGSSGGDRYVHRTVRAAWPNPTARDAPPRTGVIPAWKGAEPGATRKIWVDGSGELAVRPRPHARTVADAVYLASAATLGCGAPILLAYWLLRRRCDHHRYALWDAEWARLDHPRIG